jgi:transcriptional regulator of arginine metabolism
MGNTDSKQRQDLLRKLLAEGQLSTQEELADALRQHDFDITQSTISRDLRKIGVIKTVNEAGDTVYTLASNRALRGPLPVSASLGHLLVDIRHNGAMIVMHTTVGSASLVAAHMDHQKIPGILGTIAGDDTIFVAPTSVLEIDATLKRIVASI